MTTTIIIGFALGLLSALFFALYMVPQKIIKVSHATYLFTMSIGVVISALIAWLLAGSPLHSLPWQRAVGIGCGVIWGIGTLSFAAAIKRVGFTLATPVKNTTGVLGTLVGLIFFQEWRTTNPWLGLGGSILIVAAAIIISYTVDKNAERGRTSAGIGFALLSACCYASYLYPLKIVVQDIHYWEFTPWMALGIMLTGSVAIILQPESLQAARKLTLRQFILCLLGGAAWCIALLSLAASMEMVDLAVAWSLAQLNTIPAVFIGAIFFREIHFATHRKTIYLGLLVATIGTILLGLAK